MLKIAAILLISSKMDINSYPKHVGNAHKGGSIEMKLKETAPEMDFRTEGP